MGPKSIDYCPQERGGCSERTGPREAWGRDWSDVYLSQGTPRITGRHQKPGKGLEQSPPSEPPEGTNAADTVILNIWPPELREQVSVVYVVHFVIICYNSPRKLIQSSKLILHDSLVFLWTYKFSGVILSQCAAIWPYHLSVAGIDWFSAQLW